MELQAYLDALPSARAERFASIRDLIRQLYPDAVESMRYRMPTFEYRGGWISLANRKHYISVYTCMGEHIAEFRARHPAIGAGTGCLNFRDRDEIPLGDLAQVIRNALEFEH